MKLLDRYLGRAVVVNSLLALFVLISLVGFVTLLDQVDEVGRGDYRTLDAFYYVLLLLPRHAYEIFPVAVLLGSLIGLGGLASHSELIAMRASGVSQSRIIVSALRASLLVMALVLVLGELVAPETEQYAEQMRAEKLTQKVTLKTRYGFWARDGGSFVNIRTILPGAQLRDIYIYEFTPQRELRLASHAESAEYRDDHWLLHNINQSRFTDQGVASQRIPSAAWSSMLNPNLLDIAVSKPTMLSVWGLYQYIRFMHDNSLDARRYEVVFWGKLVTPLITLAMIFLSVPLVFGALRSVTVGQRIFVGALLGSLFLLLNKAFGNMAVVYQLNPLFAASFPGLLLVVLGIWVTRRHH